MINTTQLSFLDKMAIVSGWDHFTRAKKTEDLFDRFEKEPTQNFVELQSRVKILNDTFKNPQAEVYLGSCNLVFLKIHKIALWILGFLTSVISEKNFEDRVKKIESTVLMNQKPSTPVAHEISGKPTDFVLPVAPADSVTSGAVPKKNNALALKNSLNQEKKADPLTKGIVCFYDEFLKPVISKGKGTAPFLKWLKREYPKLKNHKSANPNCLWNAHPEVLDGIFVDIKTDGDSIFRSIGTGLILKEWRSKDPKKAFQSLIEKCGSIVDELEVKDLEVILNSAKAREEKLRNKSLMSPEKERGKCVQLANLIQKYKNELSDSENEIKIRTLIRTSLRDQLRELESKLVTNLEKLDSPDQVWQKVLSSIHKNNFDKALISFLRMASSLYYILNFLDDDNVIIDDDYNSHSVFELHMGRAIAQNPKQDDLKGSLCEISVLEVLFNQPINFGSCENLYEVPYPVQKPLVSHFNIERTPFKGMKPLYILQRCEHIGLILV